MPPGREHRYDNSGGVPLTANQILFGNGSGQIAQSASLLWDNGTGIFDIGSGNFTAVVLSNNTYTALDAGATPPTVADDIAVAIVNNSTNSAAGNEQVGVPAGGTTGQILYVINTSGVSVDITGAAGGAVTLADDGGATFIYDGAGWVAVQ